MNKQQALDKIEELKELIENYDNENNFYEFYGSEEHPHPSRESDSYIIAKGTLVAEDTATEVYKCDNWIYFRRKKE